MTTATSAVQKDLKYLTIITGLFSATLVISTVASAKLFSLGPLNLPGGVLLFPILFIFNDILTEVYGYAKSRRVVWTGLACQAFAGLVLFIVDVLPPAAFWKNQDAFHAVLGFVPRIAIGGLIAVFCGELANSFVMSKMKYWARGARGSRQAWRFVASTVVGESVDSLVVMVIAFAGVMPTVELFKTILTLSAVKIVYEIVMLPVSLPFSNWIKKKEEVDRLDTPQDTNYNPFSLAE